MKNIFYAILEKRLFASFFSVSLLIITIYLWLFLPAFGQPTTSYYSQLAFAFKNGQLHLLEQPSQELLNLQNPYDYNARAQSKVDFLWDASLYKGKYYIYWGPIPSLFLTLLTEDQLTEFGDQYAVFVFACGLFFYTALFATQLWHKYNQRLPTWAFVFLLLVIGSAIPKIWMLSYPRIYEAAIVGCQFFFIGGCYWAYSAVCGKELKFWKLAIASLHWALALGTRITILPVVLFSVVVTLVYILREYRPGNPRKIFFVLSALGLPIFFILLSLGWYNWARFDSLYESGLRYQLTIANYSEGGSLFSPTYIGENIHNYFTYPWKIRTKFPFIQPRQNVAFNENLAGILFTSPYPIIASLPFGFILSRKWTEGKNNIPDKDLRIRKWLFILFSGAALIGLILILCFYFAALRFAEEFMSPILLLATIQIGTTYDALVANKSLQKAYLIMLGMIASYSVTASVLISLPKSRIREILLLGKHLADLFR